MKLDDLHQLPDLSALPEALAATAAQRDRGWPSGAREGVDRASRSAAAGDSHAVRRRRRGLGGCLCGRARHRRRRQRARASAGLPVSADRHGLSVWLRCAARALPAPDRRAGLVVGQCGQPARPSAACAALRQWLDHRRREGVLFGHAGLRHDGAVRARRAERPAGRGGGADGPVRHRRARRLVSDRPAPDRQCDRAVPPCAGQRGRSAGGARRCAHAVSVLAHVHCAERAGPSLHRSRGGRAG